MDACVFWHRTRRLLVARSPGRSGQPLIFIVTWLQRYEPGLMMPASGRAPVPTAPVRGGARMHVIGGGPAAGGTRSGLASVLSTARLSSSSVSVCAASSVNACVRPCMHSVPCRPVLNDATPGSTQLFALHMRGTGTVIAAQRAGSRGDREVNGTDPALVQRRLVGAVM